MSDLQAQGIQRKKEMKKHHLGIPTVAQRKQIRLGTIRSRFCLPRSHEKPNLLDHSLPPELLYGSKYSQSSCRGSAEMNLTSTMKTQVQSLVLLCGLRIWHCHELWCRPVAVALIQPLAWEAPCAEGVAPKRKKKLFGLHS